MDLSQRDQPMNQKTKSHQIDLGGRLYPCDQVIEFFKKQVTPERFLKIETVVKNRSKNLVTVMENIYDRGNTSAVMRSAEAFGFHLFFQIIPKAVFKSSKRVTQGADKWLVHRRFKTTGDCLKELKTKNYKIYVTDLEGGRPIDQVSFDKPVALCFGNEKTGASRELVQRADERIYLPMEGFVQSFNISVAAALCFQFIYGQHQKKQVSPLSPGEQKRLMACYLYRSCGSPDLSSIQ